MGLGQALWLGAPSSLLYGGSEDPPFVGTPEKAAQVYFGCQDTKANREVYQGHMFPKTILRGRFENPTVTHCLRAKSGKMHLIIVDESDSSQGAVYLLDTKNFPPSAWAINPKSGMAEPGGGCCSQEMLEDVVRGGLSVIKEYLKPNSTPDKKGTAKKDDDNEDKTGNDGANYHAGWTTMSPAQSEIADALRRENGALNELVAQQAKEIKNLEKQIKQLQAKLAKKGGDTKLNISQVKSEITGTIRAELQNHTEALARETAKLSETARQLVQTQPAPRPAPPVVYTPIQEHYPHAMPAYYQTPPSTREDERQHGRGREPPRQRKKQRMAHVHGCMCDTCLGRHVPGCRCDDCQQDDA